MIVQAVPSDLWDVLWEGGMFNLDITAVGCAIATGGPDVLNNIGNVDKMRKKAENFEYTGFKCPFLTASEMYHDTYDAYWQRNRAHVENINIPVWCQDTWNDLFPLTMPRWCAKMGSPNKMFTMSIGSHGAPNAQASFGFVQQNLRWFDFWLKGIRNGVDQDVKKRGYQYYVQQAAKWRTLPTFTGTTSVPEARNTNFHLTSDAAHPLASGGLDKTPSGDPVSAQYTYNPASGALDGPAHYWAQNNAEQYDSEFQANNDPSGPQDQRSEQTGRVAFAATPLKADTEVTGPVTMHLCATTTAEDTDFVFKLVDVYPDEFVAQGPQPGYWKFVTEGQIKGQFRSEQLGYFHKWPIPPAPKAVCYDIAAHPTSYVFKKGHSMAVIVQSADAVRYRPNTNPAVVTVVSTKQNPSFVTLPIRPGAGR
jgi:putative CocE/NonD family hydrolase